MKLHNIFNSVVYNYIWHTFVYNYRRCVCNYVYNRDTWILFIPLSSNESVNFESR